MSRVRLARADLKYMIFTELYQKLTEPKLKRRAFHLLEAAIACYSRRGLDSVTMEMIAREAGVTRPLLKHYFSDADEIRDLSVMYIRLLFQKIAIEGLMSGKTPDEMLARYVDSCFYWVVNFRVHALVWLAFLHRASGDKKLRDLNTAAASVGEDRIAHLLEKGVEVGVFDPGSSTHTAKLVQSLITGSLVVHVSENMSDEKAFAVEVREQILRVAGARRLQHP